MTWVKLDDQFYTHRKVAGMDYRMLPAVGLHILALTWCASQLTDGFVPRSQPARLAGDISELLPKASVGLLVSALLDAGMWEEADGGYQIHDYLEYNPSREEALEKREAQREAKVAGGRARAAAGQRENGRFTSSSPAGSPADTPADDQQLTSPVPVPVPQEESLGSDERESLNVLKAALGSRYDFTTELEFVRVLLADFPLVDIVEELRKWKTWLLDKPLTTNSRPHSQIRNWMKNAKPTKSTSVSLGANIFTPPPIDMSLWTRAK